MSISDLKKIIIQKLESKYGAPLNSEICIPSDEYIRLQFWPKNPATQTASQYTGRFNIKYKIQTRQLSKFHPDAHYCAALFQYMRLFSIKFRKYTSFICADDKHKIAIGEGIATSTGVRNKKSLVPQNVDLTSSDHDYTKLSLTPSVTLFIDIPESINESFYHGQVYVSYKDTTFQPSTAIQHATEIYNNIKKQHQENLPEMLLLSPNRHHLHDYANVGNTYTLMVVLIIDVRTAPYHSWMNPAERVMSILNLALQGVTLQHDKMDDILEDIFKSKNTLEEICLAAEGNKQLAIQLQKSIEEVQSLLKERTIRLSLNEKSFQHYKLAYRMQIDELFEKIYKIDETLELHETSLRNALSKHGIL
ncbi:hypothetical protein GLOIN_2v1788400 [Rhizophagus irregularis DAOM 181602=DAOM 197198]|uniref:Uncharacterized protein n=1 Tax=Rhizophagus irregularis (strain DAOM 181602 / DAOM 197198 / MUCL 43194) TaxID=747089 RepID=U9TD56_RHIID|nr:hypothetical protein GLOIN_2v1788400 [Rhizophagus irregularis DAOM 181602=DAOM 197198]